MTEQLEFDTDGLSLCILKFYEKHKKREREWGGDKRMTDRQTETDRHRERWSRGEKREREWGRREKREGDR